MACVLQNSNNINSVTLINKSTQRAQTSANAKIST